MDSVGFQLGIQGRQEYSKWYTIGLRTMRNKGCGGILHKYQGSIYALLKAVYPEHDWIPWKFQKFPIEATEDPIVARRAVETVENELKLPHLDAWYDVSQRSLQKIGVLPIDSHYGGLFQFLSKFKSEHNWDESRFLLDS